MSEPATSMTICVITQGPPIDQVSETAPQDEVSAHTFYYRLSEEPKETVRLLHVLFYQSVLRTQGGDGVTASVVTTNHNPVLVTYLADGTGSFLAHRPLVEARRL